MLDMLKDLPKATKVFLVINVALFILTAIFPPLMQILALHYFESSLFMFHQTLTHIFMHGGLAHIMFNMYALILFGSIVEKVLGTKRFCILYFFSAIGAFVLHMGIVWFQLSEVPADTINQLYTKGAEILADGMNYSDEYLGALNLKFNSAMVGASGAIMGLLMAFALLYPNEKLQIIFIPIAFKAKYFIPFYMLIELFLGVRNFEWDNIAHFAHLGGAIFGGLLMFYWINKMKRHNEQQRKIYNDQSSIEEV